MFIMAVLVLNVIILFLLLGVNSSLQEINKRLRNLEAVATPAIETVAPAEPPQ